MATDDCHTTNCYFFLCGQERRAQVQVHEETALNDHILLVLGSNTKLETQMAILQQEVLLRHKELQERSRQVSGLEKEVRPLAQQVSRCDNTLSAVQRSLEEQRDHISSVQLQLVELSSVFGPGVAREELGQIRASLDALRQQVSVTEGLKDHLASIQHSWNATRSTLESSSPPHTMASSSGSSATTARGRRPGLKARDRA